ncbi:MAG TPA: hypothetical protein VMV46_08320 [Thermoanaerobaculia bacterium]|nr:hypothetical protein [Thermoanaerobaculia bacterium]
MPALAIVLATVEVPAAAEKGAARVEWLRANVAPLASIDPRFDDSHDLLPLQQALAGARVVMLGEATRGDGSAFLAKARVIRFLHEEMEYDLLVPRSVGTPPAAVVGTELLSAPRLATLLAACAPAVEVEEPGGRWRFERLRPV